MYAKYAKKSDFIFILQEAKYVQYTNISQDSKRSWKLVHELKGDLLKLLLTDSLSLCACTDVYVCHWVVLTVCMRLRTESPFQSWRYISEGAVLNHFY